MTLPRRLRPTPWVAAVLVAGVALTGCGGGGDEGAREAGRPAPTTATAGATVPPASAPVTTTVAPLAVGTRHAVGVRTATYVDATRPTASIPGYGGAPDRTFPVTIWYPATGDPDGAPVADAPPDTARGPYPLVVFSHGYAVTPDFYAELLARWAAVGYVVAAPTYPLLSGVPAGPSHDDYGKVFGDTSFVLGRVLAELGGLVDATRVATAGQSDGEVAAYGLGFLECCRDARVKAVIAMAGNLGNVNNPVRRDTGVPVLHVMGEADELQPYAESIAWDRENLTAPRWMLTLVGGTHAPPYRSPASPHFAGVVDATTAFLDGTLKAHPERLAAIDDVVETNGARFRLER